MKKFIVLSSIVLILILLSTNLNAQDLKGKYIVGSKVFSLSSTTNAFNFTIDPSFGKYVSNKVGIGAMLDFDYSKAQNEEALENWSVGPFLKYYFLNLRNKNYLYSKARVLYGQSEILFVTPKEKRILQDDFTTEGVGIGFESALNNYLSLEFEPGIALTQRKNISHTDFTFDVRFEYRFGEH